MEPRKKLISIVTPCFNEEMNVRECRDAVREVFARELPGYEYEHVFCDNASVDATLERLRELAAEDPRVRVIANARNFGPFNSMFNGLLACSGDAIIPFVPADLQDPPELIPQFVREWQAGHEIVYGGVKENPLVPSPRYNHLLANGEHAALPWVHKPIVIANERRVGHVTLGGSFLQPHQRLALRR